MMKKNLQIAACFVKYDLNSSHSYSFIAVEDDAVEKKLTHRQKQRAAKRAKKKAELVQKRKALKQAKKNVSKQTEVAVEEDAENSSDEETAPGKHLPFFF